MLVMAVADAGIGIVVYPVLKKRNASIAIGYFEARIVESLMFVITAISLLLLLTLSHEFVQAGAPDASHFQTLGELLLAVRDWAGHVVLDVAVFPLGALIFYYVLYQSKLTPRWLSGWGLVGALSYWAASLLVMFSLITFTVVYGALAVIWFWLMRRYVVEGPQEHDSEPAPPKAPSDDDVAPLSFAY